MWPFSRRETKASAAGPLVYMLTGGRAVMMPRNYAAFADEGYRKNVVAYRAIAGIARCCGSMPWIGYQGDADLPASHPLSRLLRRANPRQGFGALVESLVSFRGISGQAYLEAAGPKTGPPMELWALRPDRMKVLPGPFGLPRGFEIDVRGQKKTFDVDPVTGEGPVRQWAMFNPLDDWHGMSPLEAAALGIDQHNASSKWNLRLLQNSGRPSGMMLPKPLKDGGYPTYTAEQRDELKRQLREALQGAENAGEIPIGSGGWEFVELSIAPKDMDWIQSRHTSARDVANALGYPPMLLGIPGDNTYSNYQEARRALWEDTILPEACSLRDELNAWLAPRFGENVRIDFDADQVPALAAARREKWEQIDKSSFITINEKREALGYKPVDGGDTLYVAAGMLPVDAMAMPEDDDQEQDEDAKRSGRANGAAH